MRLGYVIAYVPDVAACVGFYEAAFGLTRRFIADGGSYAEMETGEVALAFAAEDFVTGNGVAYRAHRPDEKPAATEIGLVVDDVAAALERAVAAGATVAKPPTVKPWGQTVAYLRDPNGVLIELCTPMG